MPVDVTVTNAETLDNSDESSLLVITFTNTNEFAYGDNASIYYCVLLTDNNSDTQQVIFKVDEATGATVPASTAKSFTMENSQNLVAAITPSNGRICYTA